MKPICRRLLLSMGMNEWVRTMQVNPFPFVYLPGRHVIRFDKKPWGLETLVHFVRWKW